MSEPFFVIELVNSKKDKTNNDQLTFLGNTEIHYLEIKDLAETYGRIMSYDFEKAYETLLAVREFLLTTFTMEECFAVDGVGAFQLVAFPETEEDKEKLYNGNTDGLRKEVLFRPHQNFENSISFLSEN